MSLILDALRKSEAERRRGQSPDLYTGTPVAPPVRASAWRHLPILAGGALVLVAVALLFRPGASTRGDDADARDDAASAVVAVDADAADDAHADATTTTPSLPPPPQAPARASVPTPASAAPPPASTSPHAVAPAQPVAPPAATLPIALPPPVASAPAAPVAPADPPLPTIAVLSAGEREGLPPLKLSMHVYNDAPAQRFAIIDGQRVTEGASLGNAVVSEIRRDGVVLEVAGQRVLLPRP